MAHRVGLRLIVLELPFVTGGSGSTSDLYQCLSGFRAERLESDGQSGASRPTPAIDHAGVPAGKRTFTARACAASPLVCDARAGFSLTQLDQSFPREIPQRSKERAFAVLHTTRFKSPFRSPRHRPQCAARRLETGIITQGIEVWIGFGVV